MRRWVQRWSRLSRMRRTSPVTLLGPARRRLDSGEQRAEPSRGPRGSNRHMEAAIKRATHDSVFLEQTRSICPVCRQVLDAEVLGRDGKVFLRRRCPDHGEFEALVYGDAERYVEIQRYNKPGERPLRLQTEAVEGCPRDCGICPEHKQHTCLGIIEVNTGCNLDCPICFADSGSGHQPDGFSLSLSRSSGCSFVEAEGEPEAIQLSGGEPSIHPQILDMLAAAKARGIKLVMLNTNGIRLARDPRFAHCRLRPHEPSRLMVLCRVRSTTRRVTSGREEWPTTFRVCPPSRPSRWASG